MPALPSPFPSVIRNKGRLLLGRQNFVIGGAKEKGREREKERHGVAHSERSATCIRFGVEARQDPLSGKVHTGRSVPPSLAPTSLGGRLSQPFLPFFQCRTHWLEEGPLLSLSLSSSHRCRYNSRYKPREEISSRKYASSHTERTQPPRYLLHYYPAVFSSITDTSPIIL